MKTDSQTTIFLILFILISSPSLAAESGAAAWSSMRNNQEWDEELRKKQQEDDSLKNRPVERDKSGNCGTVIIINGQDMSAQYPGGTTQCPKQ